MPKKYDLTGYVFGKLTVLGMAERSDASHIKYRCLCSCGKEITVRGSDLNRGDYKSCGAIGCKNVKNPKKNESPMGIRKDCFAYVSRDGRHTCSAMSEVYCLSGQCKFYAPIQDVCGKCEKKKCDSCLTVSYQKQIEMQKNCDGL